MSYMKTDKKYRACCEDPRLVKVFLAPKLRPAPAKRAELLRVRPCSISRDSVSVTVGGDVGMDVGYVVGWVVGWFVGWVVGSEVGLDGCDVGCEVGEGKESSSKVYERGYMDRPRDVVVP